MTDESWRGKVGRLQSDEIEAFLAAARRTGR